MHEEVIRSVADFATELGFAVLGLTFSPIRGPEGNIEYLIRLSKNGTDRKEVDITIEARLQVVAAHAELS